MQKFLLNTTYFGLEKKIKSDPHDDGAFIEVNRVLIDSL